MVDLEGQRAGTRTTTRVTSTKGGADPHFWLDPLRMADLGDAVAPQLAEIDPDHAEEYRANAADLRLDLERLDREYADGLADCERHTVVVSHDAFGYLEKYGLHFEPIAGLSPDAEPTPAHLAELQEICPRRGHHHGVHRDAGQPEAGRDARRRPRPATPRSSTRSRALTTDSTDDYLSLMRSNLANLQAANGC